jgi:hypothetical protein
MEIKIDPKIEKLLPPLEGEEYEQLAEDIAQRGVQVPIVVDQDGCIIDGHTRYRIATGLGIEVPYVQITVADEDERIERALALNTQRRKQVSKARLKALAKELHQRGWSYNRIAKALNLHVGTVYSWLAEKKPQPITQPVRVFKHWFVDFVGLLHDFLGRHESYLLVLDRARDTAQLDYTESDGKHRVIEVNRVGTEEGEEIFTVRVLTVDEGENEVEELREEVPFSSAARIIRNVLRPPLRELLEKL